MTDFGGAAAGATPSGWYPDPAGGNRLRYFDGAGWTDNWAEPTGAAASPSAGAYPGAAPPQQGMSGCLKAFLIVLAISVVGGIAVFVSLIVVGNRVVHHLSTTIAGTPGRPSSLPSGASDYAGERQQDHVAGSGGSVAIGSLGAVATNWSRTTDNNNQLICGDVTIHRSTATSNNPFDSALQVAGDFAWELETPSGSSVSLDPSSSVSALSDYLTTGQTGDANGKVCFADPGGSGQFAITWQPRLFRAERAVWIVRL